MRKSKQIRTGVPPVTRHLACLSAILPIVLILAVLVLAPAPAQLAGSHVDQQPAATNAAARNTALIAATQEVLKETSDLRQLSIVRAVQSSTQSRAEIERAVVKNLDEDITPADMHAAEVTLKKLGLVPQDFQYRALMTRLLTEQVAGYYDPKTQQFHLADWIDLDGQKPIMAHELTHALQDQHFNLRRFEHWPKGDSDAELAAHALIEGDATLAMALYVANNPLRVLAFLKSLGATGLPTKELDKAPRALRETLLFPYQDGEKWVSVLYRQGGWDRVTKAFTELPQSTEQILDQFLKSPAESRRAAAGWGGDRFALYEGPRGEAMLVSLSVWDTESDAREFFDTYVKRTELRYPDATSIEPTFNAQAPAFSKS